jgi:putative endonuclease
METRILSGKEKKVELKVKLEVEKIFYTYMLLCNDNTFYIGSTNDIQKRLHAHNNTKAGAHYTKIRRPVTLIYKEEYKTNSEAKKRESQLKKLNRLEKEKLMKEA